MTLVRIQGRQPFPGHSMLKSGGQRAAGPRELCSVPLIGRFLGKKEGLKN